MLAIPICLQNGLLFSLRPSGSSSKPLAAADSFPLSGFGGRRMYYRPNDGRFRDIFDDPGGILLCEKICQNTS